MKSSFCKTSNQLVHYLEAGSGDTIVLLPSTWVTSFSYQTLGELLSSKFRVLIPDIYKGKSKFAKATKSLESYSKALEEFLSEMKIQKYFLIGISGSGFISTYFIHKCSNKPQKLLLFSTSFNNLPSLGRARLLFTGYTKLYLHNFQSLKGILLNITWLWDAFMFVLRHPYQFVLESQVELKIIDENKEEPISPIPAKLFVSKKDEFLPFEYIIKRNSIIKNLEIEILEGNHTWFFTNKELFLEKVELNLIERK